jgi:hypothetical protein
MTFFIFVSIVVIHLLVYSIPPIFGSFLDKNKQVLLNYTFLGVLFTIIQIFDSLYSLSYDGGLILNGGDIAYSALIFATVYLIVSQSDPKVVRHLIYIFIVNSAFLFALFGYISSIKNSIYLINYNITDVLLEFSFLSLLFTLFLFSSEIILILFLIKQFTKRFESQLLVTISLGVIYYLVIILDGILYPIGINIIFDGNLSITNGVLAKVIFGAGFSTILVLLLIIRPGDLSNFISSKISILDYFLPLNRKSMKAQLVDAEVKIKQLEKIIPICASCKKIRDDDGYWNQLESFMTKHKDIVFTHGSCPDCTKKILDEIEEDNDQAK